MIFKQHMDKQFVEALYGELTGQTLVEFEAHLDECPQCRSDYQGIKDTANMFGDDLVEPDSGNLDDFWERLTPRLKATELEHPKPQIRQLLPIADYRYSWVASIAAAVLLVITGIFLGRISHNDAEVNTLAKFQKATFAPADIADFQNLLSGYLARSKALMLGMEHMEYALDNDIDLSGQRELSRVLLREGRRLRTHRVADSNPEVEALVAELETLLLQLANSSGDDLDWTIKMIQDGLYQKSIIFQITLTELGQDRQ